MDRDSDQRFRTADGVLIVDGLRVWDSDREPSTVCLSKHDIDLQWPGRFRVRRDTGGTMLLRGEHLATVDPHNRVDPAVLRYVVSGARTVGDYNEFVGHSYVEDRVTKHDVAEVETFISADDGAVVVQISTAEGGPRIRVNVNDGAVYEGRP